MELQLVWGWQPALYLFLGGLGAGAFAVAACLYLFGKSAGKAVETGAVGRGAAGEAADSAPLPAAGMPADKGLEEDGRRKSLALVSWAAVACLAVGLLLLLSELVFPLRGLMMWQSFANLTSWMTMGAWLLFASVVFIFLTAVALTEPLAKRVRLEGKASFLKACFAVGGILSLGVCAYTGILLMSAPGVPLWNTPLLPCLFTVSALDTGVALNEIVFCAVGKRLSPRLRKTATICTLVLVALEIVVVAALLACMASGGGYGMESYSRAASASAALLTTGELAPWFWAAFVGIGLACPVACAAASRFAKTGKGHAVAYVGAAAVLIGGCALRFLILLAGVHADVIAVEVAKLIL